MNISSSGSTQVLDQTMILVGLESNLAMIEFNLDTEVIWVNDHFAQALGYTISEMKNMVHKQFCPHNFVNSSEYNQLWENLKRELSFKRKFRELIKRQFNLV